MLNRLLHKVLFTSEIIPYERLQKTISGNEVDKKKVTDSKNLKYNIDVPEELTYDHYKNKALQRQKSSNKRTTEEPNQQQKPANTN